MRKSQGTGVRALDPKQVDAFLVRQEQQSFQFLAEKMLAPESVESDRDQRVDRPERSGVLSEPGLDAEDCEDDLRRNAELLFGPARSEAWADQNWMPVEIGSGVRTFSR